MTLPRECATGDCDHPVCPVCRDLPCKDPVSIVYRNETATACRTCAARMETCDKCGQHSDELEPVCASRASRWERGSYLMLCPWCHPEE